MPEPQIFQTGQWGDHIEWALRLTSDEPTHELVTAVFCVAVTSDDKVVLARSERGWGLLGGHVEDNETIPEALVRESQEEGGFTPSNPMLFAVRELTSHKPTPHQNPDKHYPFPTSYLMYYWAATTSPIIEPTGAEILESRAFTIDEVRKLGTLDLPIIEAGYQAYLESLV